MSEYTVQDDVARQYEEWVYPEPVDDLDQWSAPGRIYADDPSSMQWAYWPRTGLPADMEILIAGCGTLQAASIAYNNPTARVLGIDLSQASLDATLALKKKHGLDNLEVRELPLQDVKQIGRRFHQVSSTGVLHHLEDPAAGLAALREVVRRDGVLALMLYGRYARTGVYMMQNLFRMLGVQQDREGVTLVRATLDALADWHPANEYRRRSADLDSDAGYVDTFLHPCDRAYAVPEILDLLRGADVTFMGWNERFRYYPDGVLAAGSPLFAALAALEEEQLWAAMELINGGISVHGFYACRGDRPAGSFRVALEDGSPLGLIPVPRQARIEPGTGGAPSTLVRPPFPPIPLTGPQTGLWQQFDGVRTLGDAYDEAQIHADRDAKVQFGRNFLRSLSRLGMIHIRFPAAQ